MVKPTKASKKARGTIKAQKAWITKFESTLNSLIAAPAADATPEHREQLVVSWENVNGAIAKYLSALDSFQKQHATSETEHESCAETIDYMNLKRKAIHDNYVAYITECDKVLASISKQNEGKKNVTDPLGPLQSPPTAQKIPDQGYKSNGANLHDSTFDMTVDDYETELSLANLEEQQAKLELAKIEAQAKLLLSQQRALKAKSVLKRVKSEYRDVTDQELNDIVVGIKEKAIINPPQPKRDPPLYGDTQMLNPFANPYMRAGSSQLNESYIDLPGRKATDNVDPKVNNEQDYIPEYTKIPERAKPPEVGLIDYAVLQQGLGLTNFRVEEKFAGDELSYFHFIDNFERTTTPLMGRPGLMLHILANSCTGRAKRIVDQCAKHRDPSMALSTALNELKMNFGQPEVLRNVHLQQVIDGPPIANNAGALMDFLTDLKGCKTVLTRFGHSHDLNSVNTITSIFDRLPRYLRQRFVTEADRAGNAHDPNFDFIITFLEKQVRLSNNLFGRRLNPKPLKTRDGKVNAFDTGERGTEAKKWFNSKAKCLCCKEKGHYVNQCKVFLDKTTSEQFTLLKRNRSCFNCMGPHHVRDCKSDHNCKTCGGRHHSLLHSVFNRGVENASATRTSDNAAINQPITRCKNARVPVIALHAHTDSGSKVPIYALLDSGADASICTHTHTSAKTWRYRNTMRPFIGRCPFTCTEYEHKGNLFLCREYGRQGIC